MRGSSTSSNFEVGFPLETIKRPTLSLVLPAEDKLEVLQEHQAPGVLSEPPELSGRHIQLEVWKARFDYDYWRNNAGVHSYLRTPDPKLGEKQKRQRKKRERRKTRQQAREQVAGRTGAAQAVLAKVYREDDQILRSIFFPTLTKDPSHDCRDQTWGFTNGERRCIPSRPALTSLSIKEISKPQRWFRPSSSWPAPNISFDLGTRLFHVGAEGPEVSPCTTNLLGSGRGPRVISLRTSTADLARRRRTLMTGRKTGTKKALSSMDRPESIQEPKASRLTPGSAHCIPESHFCETVRFCAKMAEREKLIQDQEASTVVLRFPGRHRCFQEVDDWVHAYWSKGGIVSINNIGHGLYLVKFEHPQAVSQVLAQGPWMCGSHYAFVAQWRHGLVSRSSRCLFPSRPLWIELPGLPKEFQGSANMQGTAKLFAQPLIIQSPLDDNIKDFLAHPRMCVLWEQEKKIPEMVTYVGTDGEELHKQKVLLRCLPRACSRCKILGHDVQHCTSQQAWMTQVPQTTALQIPAPLS